MNKNASNNNITISAKSRVSIGLLLGMAGIVLALGTALASTVYLARSAMPRAEALEIFVTEHEWDQSREQLDARLERIEGKLDRLIERE